MRRVLSLILIIAIGLSLQASAPACSLAPGFLPGSNFELVRDAQGIVLAKAVKLIGDKEGPPRSQVEFEILKVLKGPVEGKSLKSMGWDRWEGDSSPEDFSGVRRGALSGACQAYDYKIGSQFLLFLRRGNEAEWFVSGPPFARVNEEVSGLDAPWVAAVTQYVRIAALGTVEQQKESLRELAAQPKPIPGLAADIERHFATPHGSKPYEDLKKMYDAAASERARTDVLWAFARGKHTAAVELICGLINSGEWTRTIGPVIEYAQGTKSASVRNALVNQLVSLKERPARFSHWKILEAVTEGATAADVPLMLELLGKENVADLALLKSFFARFPDPKATAIFARHPEKTTGKEWEATFRLAATGDAKVVAWALDPANVSDNLRWMAPYVIAISPLTEADRAAQKILQGTDYSLISALMSGYGRSRSPKRVRRLLEGFELRDKNPGLDQTVREALYDLVIRGDAEAIEAMSKLPPAPEGTEK